jgi:hypothetical protein
MKAMLGVSLYSCLYLNLKNAMSFLLLLISTLQRNWKKEQNRFSQKGRWEEGRREK